MIKTFQSIDELLNEIVIDKNNNSPFAVRYPVRLILCNNFNSFKQIVRLLSSKEEVTLLPLNSLLPHQDGWLTLDDIVDTVKFQRQDSIIVPLSELIRFFSDSDFNALLTTLFEIENSVCNSFRRFYIPILGLKERFETVFFNRFHRKDKLSPVWCLDDSVEKKITINYICFETEPKESFLNFQINNIYSWLDIWKIDNYENIICRSKTMGYLYEKFLPDGIFHIQKIETYKDYLENIKGLIVPFDYKKQEANFWKTLAKEIEKYDKFQIYLNQHFNIYNVSTISNDKVLELWLQNKDKYSKWLLTNWVIFQDIFNKSYLFQLLSNIKTFSDEELIEKIWLEIFDSSTSQDNSIFTERKLYLNIIHKQYKYPFHQIEDKLQQRIVSISDKPFKVQVQYLTNITVLERKYIVESLKNLDAMANAIDKNTLQTLYPELFYYLKWDIEFISTIDNQNLDDRICSYFREYNLAKVLDYKSVELNSLIGELNKNAESFYKWYYQTDSSNNIYNNIQSKNHNHTQSENYQNNKYRNHSDKKLTSQFTLENSQLIWIDGLGAEWLPLLEYLINLYGKAQNKSVDKKYICRANLPSITDCNRFDDAVHILELDEYIHKKSTYTYPDDLIKQIELIERIIKKEIIASSYENITVVSDHGFTFLAQKRFGNIKKFDFSDSNHEGRCMWTDKPYQNDSEFILHSIDSGNYKGKRALVALKYTSLHDTPSREVHGGATPEEVLVPCLFISKIKKFDEIIITDKSTIQAPIYNVELLTKEISIKHPEIIILIEPHPKANPIFILKSNVKAKDKLLPIEFKNKLLPIIFDGNRWVVDLKGFKPDTYLFGLTILDQKFDLEVSVQGGIKERELF